MRDGTWHSADLVLHRDNGVHDTNDDGVAAASTFTDVGGSDITWHLARIAFGFRDIRQRQDIGREGIELGFRVQGDEQTHRASISVRSPSALLPATISRAISLTLVTFSHKLRPCNAFLDLLLVTQAGVAHESLVQSRPEEVVPLRVFPTEIQEFWVRYMSGHGQ